MGIRYFGVLWLGLLLTLAPSVGQAQSGAFKPANIAKYGTVSVSDSRLAVSRAEFPKLATTGEEVQLTPSKSILVEWSQPRDVRVVQLRFANESILAEDIVIEWWHRNWPDNGVGGWMKLDDPFNGQWVAAKTVGAPDATGFTFVMNPLDADELPAIKKAGADFRHTYKLRISSLQPATLTHLVVNSDAVVKQARLRFEWNIKSTVPGSWSPQFEARNGTILKTGSGGKNAALVDVEYTDVPDRMSNDRGQVLFRTGSLRDFSVFVDDVLREGGLFVRDIGVFVSDASLNLTHATWKGPAGEVWPEGTVMEQVARMPEQSFEPLIKAIPLKAPRHCFLGVPDLRQKIAVSPLGDIELYADSLRSPGPDADQRPWTWSSLNFLLATGEKPDFSSPTRRQVTRQLEEGWLPVVRHDWQNDGIDFTETCVASTLLGDIADLKSTMGTEPVILAARIEMKNTSAAPRTARLWLMPDHPTPMHLAVDGAMVLNDASDGLEHPGLVPVRGRINTFEKGDLELASAPMQTAPGAGASGLPPEPPQAVRYQIVLAPGQSHAIDLVIPYIELLTIEEARALKTITFTNTHDSVVRYWKKRAADSMTYEVPEPCLNSLFKANLWHVLISTGLDPVTGQSQHGAATHVYPNYLNETAMVIRSLEMRGEHREALRLLNTFLANQGVRNLTGNFKSKDGVLYAAHPQDPDPYTAQGCNMHHGFGMFAAAEHYLWTRDKYYLSQNSEKLVKAVEWVDRERQATKYKTPTGTRPLEYGLPPAGDLEDMDEFLYYYATSAYYYMGMKEAADVLTLGHQDQAGKVRTAASDFLEDLQNSVAQSVATTPVVRLRDGTYVPYVPSRAYALTHRTEGWIREALYPSLHLITAGVYPANHPYANWMIQDLEDNLFMSAESGYGLANPRQDFFNLGGFTLEPNLLDLSILYLERDQTPNFLRAFYNAAWASLYPDIACFAEWMSSMGQGEGPLYKTPDESKFIQWMRQMLIMERGDSLELGLGVPRAWMADGKRVKTTAAATHFGRLDMEITSQAAGGKITASVQLNKTAFPKTIRLRLRHPDGRPIRSATVNGKTAVVNSLRQTIELPANAVRWEVVAQF
jgi:hypothetical protein